MTIKVPFTTTAPGNFTLPHTLGVIPASAVVNMTSDSGAVTSGSVYFQSTPYDAVNLYLVSSDTGLSGYIVISTNVSPSIGVIGNSTIKLIEVVEDASTLGDVAPVLSTGGLSNAPAISIANDVMQALINGGPGGQPYNWKWNRYNLPVFYTNSLQQDYFIPGLVNVGWLESAWAVNINQTSIPKQTFPLEIDKDVLVSNNQGGYIGKAAWLPNSMLNTGTWGATPLGPTVGFPSGQITVAGPNLTGQQNPGPGVIYTNPVGQLVTPYNATTAIKDYYGNLWCMTTYGTCGATQPAWPANPTFPSLKSPNLIATTVTDGTVVWTAINPQGQGIRLLPMPPRSGIIWAIQVVGQMKAPRFSSLQQHLNPLPDDFEWAFKQGFFAECYRRSPDPRIRAKYQQEKQWWLESLDKAVRQSDREKDDFGFFPGNPSVMDTGWGMNLTTPSLPFGPWVGW